MKLLIVCATQFEVQPLLKYLEIEYTENGMYLSTKDFHDKDINVLITGVGMVNTAYMVGRHTLYNFDIILNVGVCGAFDKSLKLGQLVHVTNDILSELGAEDGENFLTYDKLNLPGEHVFSNHLQDRLTQMDSLHKVKGITVNTVHGNDVSIEKVKQLYNPAVESMEGAAFFAAIKNSGKNYDQIIFKNKPTMVSIPAVKNYTQIRAISNYVEKRDKSKWQMPLAIKNLNDFLIELINDL